MAKHKSNDGPPMGSRGVSRPMAEQQLKQHHSANQQSDSSDAKQQNTTAHEKSATDNSTHTSENSEDGHQHEGGHQHMMSQKQRLQMLRMHHQQTLWVYWTLPLLGIWLLVSPFSLGYLNSSLWVDPSGNRGPWFAESSTAQLREWRAWLMTGSDLLSGLLLLIFGWRSLRPNRPVSLWICCFVGIWLTLAPVLFWAPTAAAYANNSLVGIMVMALTILIPGMPNMIMYMQHGKATPPGWSYNPSSWAQRSIMIALGFAGFVVSRYLAMYQMGYISTVWDPVFGFQQGTQKVLDSSMSHGWPISDGGLGTISYTFEFLMGYMGSASRWRTMPWMVAFFGVLVIPLGLTHIILVISQPVIVHHWCLMCLLAAIIMLPMLPLEVDEVVAMCQHVRQAKNRGDHDGSLWKIFWKGGQANGCTNADPAPEFSIFPDQPGRVFVASIRGMSFPGPLLLTTVSGIVLMFFPTWFGVDIQSTAADIGHLGGALIVTVSVICMGEVVRIGRYCNLLLAAVVGIGPWFVSASSDYATACSILAAIAFVFSIPRGRITQTYGEWDRYVR